MNRPQPDSVQIFLSLPGQQRDNNFLTLFFENMFGKLFGRIGGKMHDLAFEKSVLENIKVPWMFAMANFSSHFYKYCLLPNVNSIAT